MVDFYPVLSRAIAGLPDKSPEARRAVYDKAKAVLLAQLRGVNPPMAEADIMRQRLALDDVIARIERDHAPVEALPPERLPPLPEPAAPPPPQPQAPEPEAVRPAIAVSVGVPPVAAASDSAARPVAPAAIPAAAEAAAPDRPRLDIVPRKEKRALPWRMAALGGVIALVVVGIATFAYTSREETLPIPQASAPSTQPAQQAAGPKINERVGTEAATPSQPQTQQPAAQPQAGIAVAQRAVLYIEPPDPSQPPRAVNGRVSWRVEAQNPGRGQALETVIRADVEVPDGGVALAFTIRRNMDQAFPASHIVGLRFTRSGDDGNGAIREAGVPQFKAEESERGAPLSAITSVLGENLFVAAMSRVPIEMERNLDLIRTRNWIDIPLRFTSGRRAIIAFEKGVSGDQRIAEGLRAWGQ